MFESGLQFLASLVEKLKLLVAEAVEDVIVRPREMAEHRTGDNGVLVFQLVYQLVHVVYGMESQPVHARVQLDVYGIASDAFLAGGADERVQQPE